MNAYEIHELILADIEEKCVIAPHAILIPEPGPQIAPNPIPPGVYELNGDGLWVETGNISLFSSTARKLLGDQR